ncbi:MAG: glutathione S-transferase family protein [Candidatus Binataceae bacterium]
MAEIILHHYAMSPFSEKIRKILAHKRVSWRGVDQPAIMPKPKLTPLTGGYRRVPVMQIGADVYCDTGIIVRKLEELFPDPTLYPGNSEGLCHAIGLWADRRLFLSVIAVVFEKMGPMMPKEFIEDRQKLMGGASLAELLQTAPDARNQVRAFLAMLDGQLLDRPFLLGNAFSLADAACFHCLWFMRNEPASFAMVQGSAGLMRWFERIDAMGHGNMQPMDPDEALTIARASASPTHVIADPADPNGLEPGMKVSVTADDYGFEAVRGTVVALSTYEIAIEREEPTLGKIVVHFPKVGFRIQRV